MLRWEARNSLTNLSRTLTARQNTENGLRGSTVLYCNTGTFHCLILQHRHFLLSYTRPSLWSFHGFRIRIIVTIFQITRDISIRGREVDRSGQVLNGIWAYVCFSRTLHEHWHRIIESYLTLNKFI